MSDLIARLEATAEDWPANLVALELEAAAALRQKEEQIAALTADRDSWADQADARVTDAVQALERARAAERELAELRAQQPDRIEIRNNPDGTLDEVVGRGSFHLEQMDTGHWWLGFGHGGPILHVNLRSRNKITATTLDDRTPAEKAENSPAQQPKAE